MEDKINNKRLFDEVNYWSNLSPFYKNIFKTYNSLIVMADNYLEVDKMVDDKEIIDFVGGVIQMQFGLSKKDKKAIDRAEFMLSPIIDKIIRITTSDSYKKTLLRTNITGSRSVNIPIGKNTLNIPITAEEIEHFITDDTILLTINDVENATINFIENLNERYALIPTQEKERPTLDKMFIDPSKLKDIEQQLSKKGFVKNGIWVGKHSSNTSRNPKEKLLAALALKIQDLEYLKEDYTDKDISQAFREYFGLKSSGYYFKFGQRLEIEEYLKLFTFL